MCRCPQGHQQTHDPYLPSASPEPQRRQWRKQEIQHKQHNNTTTLLSCQFIPYTKSLTQQSQIAHLHEHIEKCNEYNRPIQIYKCKSIDKTFPYPDGLAEMFKNNKTGKPTTIRRFLISIKITTKDNNKWQKMIHSIQQIDQKRFALMMPMDQRHTCLGKI